MKNIFITILLYKNFEFFIVLFFSTIVFLLRAFNMLNGFNVANFYNLLFISLFVHNSYITRIHIIPNDWLGMVNFFNELYVLKTIIILFWALFVNYLNSFYKNEYFEKGEEKILAIDIALCGSIFMVSSTNMLELFLALELIAFPTYILIAMDKTKASTEAAIKYFVFSVLGTLFLIVGFVTLYVCSGQVSPNQIALFANSAKIEITFAFWCVAFFIKIGVGPFFQWVPAVYQGVSGSTFVFISVITKIPLLFPFTYLAKSIILFSNTKSFYIITFLLFAGIFIAARNVLEEQNIRRVFAYTSNINLGTATLGLMFGGFNPKVFLSFTLLYIISTFSTYVWHQILNSDKFIKNEIVNIENFKKENQFALSILSVITLLNSGLPPITLFFMKMQIIGEIATLNAIIFGSLTFFLSLLVLGFNTCSYYAYFKILTSLNYEPKGKVPNIYVEENFEKTKVIYNYALGLSVLTLIVFLAGLKLI